MADARTYEVEGTLAPLNVGYRLLCGNKSSKNMQICRRDSFFFFKHKTATLFP